MTCLGGLFSLSSSVGGGAPVVEPVCGLPLLYLGARSVLGRAAFGAALLAPVPEPVEERV